MKGDKGYFDKAMSLLAVFLGILPAVVDDIDGDTCIDSCHCISARDFPTQR